MRISGGAFTSTVLPDVGESLAIVLSEPLDQPNATKWEIYVDAKLEEAGYVRIGAMQTDMVSVRNAPARVVATAMCPGAQGWRVLIGNDKPGTTAEIFLAAGKNALLALPMPILVIPHEGTNIGH